MCANIRIALIIYQTSGLRNPRRQNVAYRLPTRRVSDDVIVVPPEQRYFAICREVSTVQCTLASKLPGR